MLTSLEKELLEEREKLKAMISQLEWHLDKIDINMSAVRHINHDLVEVIKGYNTDKIKKGEKHE